MRQFVHDQQLKPVVEVGQREIVGGRASVEQDPVRRPDRGGAVRDVDVVAQDDVDPAGRSLAKLRGEFPIGPLRQIARPPAQRLQMLGKGDAKALGLDRTPRFVRRNLRSRRRGRQQTHERCDWETGRGTKQAVRLLRQAGVALPQGAQAVVESRPVVAYAGGEVVGEVHGVDTLVPQGVALQVQRLGTIRFGNAGVADQHVSQTLVWDIRARVPSGERCRVSYTVSDSMSCRRRARGPVPCAERALARSLSG